jgi:tetratricopeptide (TPR) repeat protein
VRGLARIALLPAAWLTLTAATPLPLTPPPPDLTALVPFVSAPLDKPPLKLPPLAMPAPPLEVPVVPPAAVILPAADKPTAPIPPPRALPCVGAWTGAASEALECGRARFQRGDLTEAANALEQAVRNSKDREVGVEARYWLAETLFRLGRIEAADVHFRQVATERSPALAPFALHSSGWTALVLGDAGRARDVFVQILGASHPMAVDAWARHGLGLALGALGRHVEAQRTWADLLTRRPPGALERDVLFWNGDALGRTGDPKKAVAELSRFTQGGFHPLLAAGLVRLGWWNLAAGHARESVAALRAYPGPRPPETKPESGRPPPARLGSAQEAADRDWVDTTLALALLASDDWDGGRAAAQSLETRRSPLALPVQLRVVAGALARRANAVADAAIGELMRGTLTPPIRAWLLTMKGDVARAEGKGDDARTQYDLARGIDPVSETGRYATLRLAQTNIEMREFAQALVDLAPLLTAPGDPSARPAVLLLQGEAAYRAGDYKTAAATFERTLVEIPDRPEAREAHLGLAWTALREGRTEPAGRRFAEVARLAPDDEGAVDALVLASEMALMSGDLQAGRELLDRVLARYPKAPRSEFARLNRAILMLRSGEAAAAVPSLRDWVARAPFPPLLGRAQAALAVALLAAGRRDEATKEFAAAQREGEGALASLGRGTLGLVAGKLAEATRDFTEARSDGTPVIAAAAEYGLGAIGFHRGDAAAFKTAALAALNAAPRGPLAPGLLYTLAGQAADAKDWTAALSTAKRLVTEFPDDERADDALERVGAAAAKEHVWPTTYEAYALLRQKYPHSPFVEDSRLAFAEAQVETGRAAEGRRLLEQFVTAAPADPRVARAGIVLGRARELTGDRAGALEAYAAAAAVVPPPQWSPETLVGYARLLTQAQRYDEARGLLQPLLKTAAPAVAAEGALALGETLEAQGDGAAAVEYFMTAAYLAPDSTSGRRALVAAGRAFATQKQPEAATIVYRKLLAQSNVPADLASAARRGLAELGHGSAR